MSKLNPGQSNNSHAIFAMITLESGWSPCGGIISFLKTIVGCYYMECSHFPMRPVCYIDKIPMQEGYKNALEGVIQTSIVN